MQNYLYSFETFKRILDMEERRGRLREDSFSEATRLMSSALKMERNKLKNADKNQKQIIKENVDKLKEKYEASRIEDIKQLKRRIQEGNYNIELKPIIAKGKPGYTTANIESMLLSKVLMLEMKRYYKYTPANRNDIIEELRALLDNPMPKIIIRADIHHFFESIPQNRLLGKIMEDAYLSPTSMKSLKTFIYKYNELSDNLTNKLGVPRGVAFSSYLAELYMSAFDRKIRQIEGVFFYQRYVDDIVLIASPGNRCKEDLWNELESLVKEMGFELNDDVKKRGCFYYDPKKNDNRVNINYLGYRFRFEDAKWSVLLTDDKFNRYKESIRLVFENYKRIASFTSRRQHPKQIKTDTTLQFMHRLNALTSNGHLNSRKNYVLVGIYYSNKYLTDLSQLQQLDNYLKECVNNQESFCPPKTIFQYGGKNDYDKNVRNIQEKIINEYSFVKGFNLRRIYRWSDYTTMLMQVGNMYFSQNNE